jgi:hypothetical protein
MSTAFEHPFNNLLTGVVLAEVRDPHGIEPPSTIIQLEHPWEIRVDLELSGVAAPFLCGEFEVKAFAESIGPGPEKQVGQTQVVPLDVAPPLPTPRSYRTTIHVAAGELSEGAYKLVTLITYKNGGLPLEMAAYVEGPIVQIYEGLPLDPVI